MAESYYDLDSLGVEFFRFGLDSIYLKLCIVSSLLVFLLLPVVSYFFCEYYVAWTGYLDSIGGQVPDDADFPSIDFQYHRFGNVSTS